MWLVVKAARYSSQLHSIRGKKQAGNCAHNAHVWAHHGSPVSQALLMAGLLAGSLYQQQARQESSSNSSLKGSAQRRSSDSGSRTSNCLQAVGERAGSCCGNNNAGLGWFLSRRSFDKLGWAAADGGVLLDMQIERCSLSSRHWHHDLTAVTSDPCWTGVVATAV